jgi:hypothetical protein
MRMKFLAPFLLSCAVLGNASVGTHFPGSTRDTILNITSSYGTGVGIQSKSTVTRGVGVSGSATGANGIGMAGASTYGPGVRGSSASYYGVYGESPFSGVLGYAYSNGPGVTGLGTMGVFGLGTAAPGSNGIGVYAKGSGGGTAYGIIATADSGKTENWAAWFDGNVAITGMCSPCVISDARTKKNIRALKGSLKKVLAMQAHSYEMKIDEYAADMNLAEGPQNGLLAQELEKIVPEAVHPVTAPPHYTEDERRRGVKKEGVVLKSVNYTALIPLLIAAIQEQQAEINALKAGR